MRFTFLDFRLKEEPGGRKQQRSRSEGCHSDFGPFSYIIYLYIISLIIYSIKYFYNFFTI